MINLQIRSLKNRVIKMINEEPLPIEVKRLILVELCQEISQVADRVISDEDMAARERAENNAEEGSEET